jgi:hypothetical protein
MAARGLAAFDSDASHRLGIRTARIETRHPREAGRARAASNNDLELDVLEEIAYLISVRDESWRDLG